MADSTTLSYASVSVALLAEVASPGTWVYWLTVAGPILAEGRQSGYGHVVPFFLGGLIGFYGAALFTLCLLAWGAGLHKRFKQHLFLAANILLLLMGISYLVRAYRGAGVKVRCQGVRGEIRTQTRAVSALGVFCDLPVSALYPLTLTPDTLRPDT